MNITRKRTRTVTEEVTVYVPEHYFEDRSTRGQIVDTLVAGTGHKRNGYDKREDLHDEDVEVIERAKSDLHDAYMLADKIIEVFNRNKSRS